MKRILLLLAIIICICAFASCEHTHEKGSELQSDETNHWYPCTDEECDTVYEKAKHTWGEGEVTTKPTASQDGVMSYLCTVCKKLKKEPLKYEATTTVSSAHWESAFSRSKFQNVTADIEEVIVSGGVTYKTVYKIQADNSIIYSQITVYQNGTEVKYRAKYQDGTFVWTLLSRDQTIEDVTPDLSLDDYMEPSAVLTDYGFDRLASCFSSFTYNTKTKCYEATDLELSNLGYGFKSVSVRLADGQITEINAVTTNDPEISLKVTYSKYGATKITPPTSEESK